MKKSEIPNLPKYFDRYINLVEDLDLLAALEAQCRPLPKSDLELLNKIGDKVYAPGKWTVKDILQHIADNERI
ncbi:MAG: DinB family protein, partial [Spirochaetia bacterium]|nr:DinB family protein [Spirochaetia bacterium]